MAFLFQDQNQGIRNDIARAKSAGVATVLFHPDFNRRLRNHTESADPFSQAIRGWIDGNKALAGLGYVTFTAGGDFHPALRTSAARLSGLWTSMANAWDPSKDLHNRNLHVRNDPTAELRREMRQD